MGPLSLNLRKIRQLRLGKSLYDYRMGVPLKEMIILVILEFMFNLV